MSQGPNPEHLAILKRGVEGWNQWRGKHPATRPNISGANLRAAKLARVNLRTTDLRNTDLRHADFCGADLRNADLRHADLRAADLNRANLSHANFSDADLTDAKLGRATLWEANLTRANLLRAELLGAVLTDAMLRHTNFTEANLSGANLTGADLNFAILIETNLTDARFDLALLVRTTIRRVDLRGSSWRETSLAHTTFVDVDFSEALHLQAAQHLGPSSIGIDSLYRSHGKVPDEFLRDAGVHEEIIQSVLPSIRSGPPIQWQSCFIGYSSKDEEFARRLFFRMRKANMRVWFAPEHLKAGEKLHEQLFQAIQIHDRLLLVLSEHSIKSEWVTTEIRKAREIERKENRRKLFPIGLIDYHKLREWNCFDADSGKDLAIELREYFIPDFSNWTNQDAFETAFEKLRRDLHAPKAPSA